MAAFIYRSNLLKYLMCLIKLTGSFLVLFTMLSGCNFSVKFDQSTDLIRGKKSDAPNDALACPLNFCQGRANYTVPNFQFSKAALAVKFREIIKSEPRTTLLHSNPGLDQLIFVQRSRLFGFPDTIWVQFVDLRSESSLIIYSRSNYGYWDFGINGKRVKSWLKKLKALD